MTTNHSIPADAELREKILVTVRQNVDLALSFNWNGAEHERQVNDTVDRIMSLLSTHSEERVREELQTMHTEFTKGLKGQGADFKYIMRPIMASIESRLQALKPAEEKEKE